MRVASRKLAVKLIKKWEGFMPEPYLCPAGVPTIGFGTTRYENGDEVSMDDCVIDRKRGEEILLHHLINNGPRNQNIPREFKRWNKAGGKVLAGLTARREEESTLWSA